MKFCWRITKYDPRYRNHEGMFLNNEWTSYSDIGYTFDDARFTYEMYEKTENLYIKAIIFLMECNKVSSLQVNSLEKSKRLKKDDHNTKHMSLLFNTVKENDWIEQENIEDFCKLILREKLWCKLVNNEKMFVHFGWDFYMYIASAFACEKTIKNIENSGLFVEPFRSPYAE